MKQALELIKNNVALELEGQSGISDDAVEELIEKQVFEYCEKEAENLFEAEKLIKVIRDDMLGFGVLQSLFENDGISEIMVNSDEVFYEKDGEIYKSDIRINSAEESMKIIRTICRKSGRTVNSASPITDASLEDGTRINIVLNPVSVDGHSITIRKFPDNPITRDELILRGFVSEEAMSFLEDVYKARYNIFICGGAGTGKTTLLNVLANCTGDSQRVVTIEDSAELRIHNIKNLVRLEARMAGAAGRGEISIRELIKTSLRMRPDRIIVGEVRGEEAIDMLQAMNTGHEGSISTGHANSSSELLSRLETMVLTGKDIPLTAVRRQIITAIDIVVCLSKNSRKRYITQICELSEDENKEAVFNPIYDYDHGRKLLVKRGMLVNKDKMERMYDD